MTVRRQKPQGHTQRTPDPWWAITHGSAPSISGEVSEVQGPQSRKHLKKDSVVTKPGEPVPGLLESEVARGSPLCSWQVEGPGSLPVRPSPACRRSEGAAYEPRSDCSAHVPRPSTQVPLASPRWQPRLALRGAAAYPGECLRGESKHRIDFQD